MIKDFLAKIKSHIELLLSKDKRFSDPGLHPILKPILRRENGKEDCS